MTFDLIHFSDPQTVPSGYLNFDIDPQLRLRQCIDALIKDCPDSKACFITGDLTHWGEAEAYEVLREELARLPMPVYMMMGNHDNRETFLKVFPGHPADESGFIQYSLSTPAGKMICLDTLDEGKRGGILCQQRLLWLEKELKGEQPVYLFMHHPPFDVGLPSMDGDGLANVQEFLECLSPHTTKIRHLFFGHLHRPVSGNWQGFSYSGPNSLVHQTPFDFENRKVSALSPEPPVYHKVMLYPDRVVVHARDFLHSEPRIIRGSCTEYPKP